MLVLVLALTLTNVLTLGALGYLYLRPSAHPGPDEVAAQALDRGVGDGAPVGVTRRLISVEILNPIELAGSRGRIAALAGSLVPGITRRIVYDQTLTILKDELAQRQVVADVRIHTVRRVPDRPGPDERVRYADVVEPVELDPDAQPPV